MSSKTIKQQKQSATRKATIERRKSQLCYTYELKIDTSRFSKKTTQHFNQLFLQAKWFRNAVIASEEPFHFDAKVKSVQVKVGKQFEERKLTVLSSQMKQALLSQVQDDICGLSEKKKNGAKVGKLKFKSYLNCIPLKQHENVYTLTRKHGNNGRLHLQKCKQLLRVRGLKQIPEDAEITTAKLLKRGDEYYLHVNCYRLKETVYAEKQDKRERAGLEKRHELGIDLGIASQVTCSNGLKIKYRIPIDENIRKYARKVSRTQKGSKNRRKARVKLQKAFAKHTNKKQEVINKLVSCLDLFCTDVCYQNDYVAGWQRIWGRIILETSLGGLLRKVKTLRTSREVSRWEATSQTCRKCLKKTKHALSARIFVCPKCGHQEDRDVHAAKNICRVGMAEGKEPEATGEMVHAERVEPSYETPVDMKTTAMMFEKLESIPFVKVSLVAETGSRGSDSQMPSEARSFRGE